MAYMVGKGNTREEPLAKSQNSVCDVTGAQSNIPLGAMAAANGAQAFIWFLQVSTERSHFRTPKLVE